MRRAVFLSAGLAVLLAMQLRLVTAAPLSEDECRQLAEQKTALDRQGVKDQLAKGAAAALDGEQLKIIANYLELEANLRLRCVVAAAAVKTPVAKPAIQTPGAAGQPAPAVEPAPVVKGESRAEKPRPAAPAVKPAAKPASMPSSVSEPVPSVESAAESVRPAGTGAEAVAPAPAEAAAAALPAAAAPTTPEPGAAAPDSAQPEQETGWQKQLLGNH